MSEQKTNTSIGYASAGSRDDFEAKKLEYKRAMEIANFEIEKLEKKRAADSLSGIIEEPPQRERLAVSQTAYRAIRGCPDGDWEDIGVLCRNRSTGETVIKNLTCDPGDTDMGLTCQNNSSGRIYSKY